MIDFHTHVLPEMDDGSVSAEETLLMLDKMSSQGVKKVVATPHFYAERDTVKKFFERRDRAVELLKGVYKPTHPLIYLGAEVTLFDNVSEFEDLYRLSMGGSGYVLIEMPFSHWNDGMIEELYGIREKLNLTPILAHIECFLPFKNTEAIYSLKEDGFIMQSNATFVSDRDEKKTVIKLFKDGIIDILSSDTHHIDKRPPNLSEGYVAVAEYFGEKRVKEMRSFGEKIISSAKPIKVT